jgi:hypothetical protein
MGGGQVMSGDIIRAVGYFFPPGMHHLYIDSLWEYVAAQTGIWKIDISVMVQHLHWQGNKQENKIPIDQTYSYANQFYPSDEKIFYELMTNEMPAIIERVNKLKGKQ